MIKWVRIRSNAQMPNNYAKQNWPSDIQNVLLKGSSIIDVIFFAHPSPQCHTLMHMIYVLLSQNN